MYPFQLWCPLRMRIVTAIITLSGPIYIFPKLFISNEKYLITNYKIMAATIVWEDQDLLFKYKSVGICTLVLASCVCFMCYCSIIYVTLKRHLSTTKKKSLIAARRRSSTPGLPTTLGTISGQGSYPKRKSETSLKSNTSLRNECPIKSKTSMKSEHPNLSHFSLSRLSMKHQNRSLASLMQKRELRLATCGFIISFSMFVYTIGVANMGVSESASKQQHHRNIWLAASDIFSGINPILLIIVSKSLRSRFLAILCCSCTERQYSPTQSV